MSSEHSENWWESTLDFAAKSDIGMRRTNNQDSHREVPAASPRLWRERGHVFVLADGMGAHAAGELASRLATETIASSYLKRSTENPKDALKNAVLDAHEKIRRRGDEEEAFHDMGTTADTLVLLPEGAMIAHVGDSRTYRLREGSYDQLTFDHSLLWELTRSKRFSPDKIPAHIPKNVIIRSLGPTAHPEVDLEGPFPLQKGDVFLQCSDGLSGLVSDSEMGQILSLFPPSEAAEALVNLTNLRGGPDNVTMIIVKVLGIPDPESGTTRNDAYAKRPPLSALAWGFLVAALGLFLLAFLLAFSIRWWSLIPFVAAFGSVGLFFLTAWRSLFPKEEKRTITPMGKGPYVQTSAKADPKFAEKLFDIYSQLEKAVQTRQMTIDRNLLQRRISAARAAFQKKGFGEAIRLTIQNINQLMKTLKQQGGA